MKEYETMKARAAELTEGKTVFFVWANHAFGSSYGHMQAMTPDEAMIELGDRVSSLTKLVGERDNQIEFLQSRTMWQRIINKKA